MPLRAPARSGVHRSRWSSTPERRPALAPAVTVARIGKKKPKAYLPVGLMLPVVKLARPLPKALRPLVTAEQLKMLAVDTCSDRSATADLLGRPPLRLEGGIDYILPERATAR